MAKEKNTPPVTDITSNQEEGDDGEISRTIALESGMHRTACTVREENNTAEKRVREQECELRQAATSSSKKKKKNFR